MTEHITTMYSVVVKCKITVNGSRPIQVQVCQNILPAVIKFVAENVAWLYVAMCYTVIPKILQASTCVSDIQTTSTVFYNAMHILWQFC